MSRLFPRAGGGAVLLAGFLLSCNLSDSKPDRINLQADSVLLTMSRVEVLRVDGQGNTLSILFNDSLRSLLDLSNLAAPGYHGGAATFTIHGYRGTSMVYDVTVRYDGSRASVEPRLVPPSYTIAMSLVDTVDWDLDGYKSEYILRTDVNTSIARDTILLSVLYKNKSHPVWTTWYTSTLNLTGQDTGDVSYRWSSGDSNGLVDFKVEIYRGGVMMVQKIMAGVKEETPEEDLAAYHLYLVNNSGAYVTATVSTGGRLDTLSMYPLDTVLGLQASVRPSSILYSAAADGNVKVWSSNFTPVKANDTVRLNLEAAYYVLRVRNSSFYVDRVVIDTGLVDQQALDLSLPNNGVLFNLGAYHAYTNASVTFQNTSNGSTRTFTPLPYQVDSTYGYQYVELVW